MSGFVTALVCELLGAAARRYGFETEWHAGAQLALSAVPADDPEGGPRWQDWGAPRDVLQQLKYLWPILVAYGEPPG